MKIFSYDTLESSSTEALRLLAEGESSPFVVWTRSQSAGRGRRTRLWQSPPGNLYLSLAVKVPSSWLSLVPLHVAATLVEFLEPLIAHKITLKWPNDLLLRGRKFAGILCEAAWQQNQDKERQVVIGIGINIQQAPMIGLTDYAVCALQDWFLVKPELEDLFHSFIQFWESFFGVNLGRQEILAQYEKHHLSRGQLWQDKEKAGLFFVNQGISKEGHLVVRNLQNAQDEELTSTQHSLGWAYQDFPALRKAPLTLLLAQGERLFFAHFASADDDEPICERIWVLNGENKALVEDKAFAEFLGMVDGIKSPAWPLYSFGLESDLLRNVEIVARAQGFWVYPIEAWRSIATFSEAKERVLEG